MKTERGANREVSRYYYDFGECSEKRGWAQVDTEQDFFFFGIWAHPDERKIFQFVEGDTYLTICDSDDEFAAAIREMAEWNTKRGYAPIKIDPGIGTSGEPMFERFRALGLGDLLH